MQRIESPSEEEQDYYRPPSTCQIQYLGQLYEFVFGQRADGHFVEVGAYDGITFSNTSCLADVGWAGLLVEPVPAFAAQCRKRYRGNAKVEVVEVAAGAQAGEIELVVAGALSTANPIQAAEYRDVAWAAPHVKGAARISVRQSPLDEILDDMHMPEGFEVLVVDVEGFEGEVFAGFDLDRWRPILMVVELSDTHPDLISNRLSHLELSRQLQGSGYDIVYKDLINTVMLRSDVFDELVGATTNRPTAR